MKRIAALALIALVACSPSFSARVGDFSTPIANSLGQVCWQEVDASRAPRIRTATFRAIATYEPDALLTLTDRVELQILGRREAPARECTSRGTGDVRLSEPFDLEREVSQPIEVGGASFGAVLADLVNEERFWLGASASGNVGFGEQTVRFEDGRITVGF